MWTPYVTKGTCQDQIAIGTRERSTPDIREQFSGTLSDKERERHVWGIGGHKFMLWQLPDQFISSLMALYLNNPMSTKRLLSLTQLWVSRRTCEVKSFWCSRSPHKFRWHFLFEGDPFELKNDSECLVHLPIHFFPSRYSTRFFSSSSSVGEEDTSLSASSISRENQKNANENMSKLAPSVFFCWRESAIKWP